MVVSTPKKVRQSGDAAVHCGIAGRGVKKLITLTVAGELAAYVAVVHGVGVERIAEFAEKE